MYKRRPLSRQGGIVYLHVQNVRANAWQPCMEPLFPHVKFPPRWEAEMRRAGHCFEQTYSATMCSALLQPLSPWPHTDHQATVFPKYGHTLQLLQIFHWISEKAPNTFTQCTCQSILCLLMFGPLILFQPKCDVSWNVL